MVSAERIYDFTLTGQTPLLMHRDDVLAMDELDEARKKMPAHLRVKGDDRSPPWSWMIYLYHDGSHICCPTENLMKTLMYGGSQTPLTKNKRCKDLSQSGLRIMTPFCTFLNHGKHQIKHSEILAVKPELFPAHMKAAEDLGFSLYVRRKSMGRTGTKHVRVRPMFAAGWQVTGKVVVTSSAITEEILFGIFQKSGEGGLMDERPTSPKCAGTFGIFSTVLKATKARAA